MSIEGLISLFTFKPIIPIPIMTAICGVLLVLSIIRSSGILVRILDILMLVLLFGINTRPLYPTESTITQKNNFDVIFVIDGTLSMNAEDYNGSSTRISGLKQDCQYIIKELVGSRFAVTVFDNYSRVLVPYSIDSTLVYEAIESIKPISRKYANGTNLNTSFNTTLRMLKSSTQAEDRKRIVFFLSDGENTDSKALQSFSELRSYIVNGAVIGYGTEKGGNMKTETYTTGYSDYVKLSDGSRAVSRIDENNLMKVADDMNIKYFRSDPNRKELENKVKDIKDMLVISDPEEINSENYRDMYIFLVMPLMLVLAIRYMFTRKGE